MIDWARLVTVEERKYIREKIKAAYKRKAPTYEELLTVCSAVEEEFIFTSVPSRLDYFKSGVQYEKRVAEKMSSLRTSIETELASKQYDQVLRENSSDDLTSIVGYSGALKRAKTQH